MSAMTRLRRALGPLAAAWLLCQAATLVLTTAAVGFDAAVNPIECTCGHGTGHNDCPMHHQPAPSRPGDWRLQCADESGSAVIVSLMGQAGVVPAPTGAVPFAWPRAAGPIDVTLRTLRPAPPDSPPPRA